MTDVESKSEEGVYYNAKLNMKINILKKDGNLVAQASGQSAIVLEKVDALQYKFNPAGIEILFNKEKDENIRTFTLKQGGMTLIFDKE
jgi:D-alanyl-D-alanine carboxypeptidase